MSEGGVVVGIDVSKATLDVAQLPGEERWSAGNEAGGIAALVQRLQARRPALVVLEATGGYERAVVAGLAAAGLPVVVANPRQIRAFARAVGQLAKTDRLDAAMLARFGAQVRPEPRALPDAQARALDALLTRRRQLLEMLTAEKNRLAAAPAAVRLGIRSTSAGWSGSWPRRTRTSAGSSRRVRCGERGTTCCRACRASGRC